MFVKGYRFLFFAKNMGKKIGKNKSKNVSGKYGQKRLIVLNSLQQMQLKLQKEPFKKQQKQLVI